MCVRACVLVWVRACVRCGWVVGGWHWGKTNATTTLQSLSHTPPNKTNRQRELKTVPLTDSSYHQPALLVAGSFTVLTVSVKCTGKPCSAVFTGECSNCSTHAHTRMSLSKKRKVRNTDLVFEHPSLPWLSISGRWHA